MVWILAGEGPERGALQARIDSAHVDVRLVGAVSDVAALYEAADLVVSTALWEGQPIALQEALRAGAAIVATDVGGTRETVADAAHLVPPDAEALGDGIVHLLTDAEARRTLRERALRRAAQLPTEHDIHTQLTHSLTPKTPR
jgi:glycosyltransferase involved in cell wall biosynthesis